MTTYQELVEKVSNMTEKEILRYEMETLLLASQEATETEIPSIALAMTAIHDRLASQKWITPDIKVSMPEGNSPDIHIIADSIKKLLIELMRTVPENVSLSSEELKRYRDTADKRMETGGYKERTKWRRFELLTETEAERERLEKVLDEHQLSRQDLAIILFGLRVQPEFGKEHFGI